MPAGKANFDELIASSHCFICYWERDVINLKQYEEIENTGNSMEHDKWKESVECIHLLVLANSRDLGKCNKL